MGNKKLAHIAGSLLVLTVAHAHAGDQLVNLGGAIYNDLNLSLNKNQSCQTCHQQSAGFADPENRVMPHILPVSDGSDPTLFGGRNAPTAAYAGFSPVFHHDGELFVGGLFWDGRATGLDVTATGGLGAGPTGDPLAEQAKGPFLNPVEMALGSETEVIAIIQASDYADKFEKVFGPDAFADTGVAYNNMSVAIAAFERSSKVNQFRSKFDRFVKEQGGDVSTFGVDVDEVTKFRTYVGPGEDFKSKVYSYDEADGLALFNADSYTQAGEAVPEGAANGGQCYLCHLTENFDADTNPVLTDFSYDNLGIPVNPQVAALAGPQKIDYGLGGQIDQLEAACDTCDLDIQEVSDGQGGTVEVAMSDAGKFKVSSLRNLSRTAPYGHNGFFATIYDIVHFYNARDVEDLGDPEVEANVNGDELGNLGLSLEQEMKLVLFMETLND